MSMSNFDWSKSLIDAAVTETTSSSVSDNSDRTDAWRLLKDLGNKPVDYRYAAAWRIGRLVGHVFTGEIPMMVVIPIMKDEDMAMLLTEAWEEKITWADDVTIPPERFILVSIDQVRAPVVVSRKYISRNPHHCPVCKQRALIMATQVHCTNSGCKHWDRES
jgi:hypothetical protein